MLWCVFITNDATLRDGLTSEPIIESVRSRYDGLSPHVAETVRRHYTVLHLVLPTTTRLIWYCYAATNRFAQRLLKIRESTFPVGAGNGKLFCFVLARKKLNAANLPTINEDPCWVPILWSSDWWKKKCWKQKVLSSMQLTPKDVGNWLRCSFLVFNNFKTLPIY